ncbi:MAG: translation initiation factor [Bacteroidales bacterium]
MENDWKKRLGVVYSTDPEFSYESEDKKEPETRPPDQQYLVVMRDRKNRKGKTVTLIQGFEGKEEDLKALAGDLKRKCGVGGSARDGEILIQGDFTDRVTGLLKEMGYQVKRSGG